MQRPKSIFFFIVFTISMFLPFKLVNISYKEAFLIIYAFAYTHFHVRISRIERGKIHMPLFYSHNWTN